MTDGFFNEKRAAAVFKHAILNQYVTPFTMKTGSTSTDHRVAFIDGYAGEGRYDDGAEGSPALLLAKAKELAPKRRLEVHLVEEDAPTYEKLTALVAAERDGAEVRTYRGDVAAHLDALLEQVAGIPVFVFLDPYGLMIPFTAVTKILTSRPAGLGQPATEVLINFTVTGLRRIAGHLYSATPSEATLRRMDDVCGDGWWRQTWLDHAPAKDSDDAARAAAEEAIVTGYADRLGKAAGASWWTTDVRNAARLKPLYHLVFLTRHRDGLRVFGDALSNALGAWRRRVWEEETAGTLLHNEDLFKAQEAALAAEWIDELERNLIACLAKYGSFRVAGHYSEVFGSALALAREKHLRAAWGKVYAAGHTKTDAKGSPLVDKLMEPP